MLQSLFWLWCNLHFDCGAIFVMIVVQYLFRLWCNLCLDCGAILVFNVVQYLLWLWCNFWFDAQRRGTKVHERLASQDGIQYCHYFGGQFSSKICCDEIGKLLRSLFAKNKDRKDSKRLKVIRMQTTVNNLNILPFSERSSVFNLDSYTIWNLSTVLNFPLFTPFPMVSRAN